MKVNSIKATQPNFGAKVKNNAFMRSYVENSSKQEKRDLYNALQRLDTVFPEDVLEISGNPKRDEYVILNSDKCTLSKFDSNTCTTWDPYFADVYKKSEVPLSKYLDSAADPYSNARYKIFYGDGTKCYDEDATKEEKDVLDMLA